MELLYLLPIFAALVLLDKVLTYAYLEVLKTNNPKMSMDQILSAEKNTAARWFFQKCGLRMGSLLFGLITFCTLTLGYILLSMIFGPVVPLILIGILYTFTILNNFYWLWKVVKY